MFNLNNLNRFTRSFHTPAVNVLRTALKNKDPKAVSGALELFKEKTIVLDHDTAKKLADFNFQQVIKNADSTVAEVAEQKLSKK
jgi:hypothetical protein